MINQFISDAHVHYSLNELLVWAGSDTNPCRDKNQYIATGSDGYGLDGYASMMYFSEGICSYTSPVNCTSTDNNKTWLCKDQSTGDTLAACDLGDNESVTSCASGSDEVTIFRQVRCAGSYINCDS
jgi:hypothetical protein